MKIKISTAVNADLKTVIGGFNSELFLQLNPPFPKVALERFDGCKKGDVVKMKLNFILWKDEWRSDIIHHEVSTEHFLFIDEGTTLPFPFSQWKHQHLIERTGDKTIITDNIEYFAKNHILTFLLYPLLYLQFLYRKPIYKKIFG